MADEGEFQAPAGGFVTAGSKKAVRPSAAPFDPFADDAAPAPTPASGALFQTAGARRPVRPKAAPAATARKAPKAAFDPFADDDAPAAPSTKTPKPGRRPAYRTPATASTRVKRGAAPTSTGKTAFCEAVERNHGCCLACGYSMGGPGECKASVKSEDAYCKSLEAPSQRGCCAVCGQADKKGKNGHGDASPNCCSAGGSWAGTCDEGGEHNWSEGYQACNGFPAAAQKLKEAISKARQHGVDGRLIQEAVKMAASEHSQNPRHQFVD